MKIELNGELYNAGWIPCGHKLLVAPIEVEERTSGGIVLTQNYKEREDMAQVEALVLAVGRESWSDRPGDGNFPWCKVGDTIMMAKYAGVLTKGQDDRNYRIINDLDVVAVKVTGE